LISGPTIIILNKNYYIEDGKMLNMMKKLKDAKIMFSSGKDAAKHLNKVWFDINSWWFNKKTVNARKEFIKNISPSDKGSLEKWINFFRKKKNEK